MNSEKNEVLRIIAFVLAVAFALGAFGCNTDSNSDGELDAINQSDSAIRSIDRDAVIEQDGSDGAVPAPHYRPIVFVHGRAGSADQFETQALRFASNDYLLRLKTSSVDGTNVVPERPRSDKHTNLVIIRNKEFVGDADAELYVDEENLANDSLTVNGIELCTTELSPASNRTIGMFVSDINADQENDLSRWLDDFAALPFISGADVFVAASDPPDNPIKIVVKDRSEPGKKQVMRVPNWVSTHHRISVQFNDFVQ